jgi:hypothetical protein
MFYGFIFANKLLFLERSKIQNKLGLLSVRQPDRQKEGSKIIQREDKEREEKTERTAVRQIY